MRYDAARQGQEVPTALPILSHDAADIQALSQSLAQLQLQIAQAKALAQAGDRRQPATPGVVNRPVSTELMRPTQLTQWPLPLPAPLVAVVPSAKRYQVTRRDVSLVGVLTRWTETAGWRLVLNGQEVMATSFPAHTTAYADVPLEASLLGLGDDEFDLALDALLRAHRHYQQRLRFGLTLKPALQEVWLTSEPVSPMSPVASTQPRLQP